MLVSVIIPNYNGRHFLKDCLRSLMKQSFQNFEVVIVDNGSTDGSVRFIKSLIINGFSELTSLTKDASRVNPLTRNKLIIKLIENKKNLGFAKAINQGIKKAKGAYIFLLNNDVILKKDYLEKLVNFLVKKSDFEMVQGVIWTADGKKIDNAGGRILWHGKVELYPKPLDRRTTGNPLILSATATLYRKSLFEKIGLFDEDFHSYLEDVDLSLRVWRRGLGGVVLPEATCFHLGRATSRRMGNFKARMDAKNWIFVIIKNWPASRILRYLPQIFIERLRNLSGLIKQTIWWQIPWTILVTYGECGLKIPKMVIKRLSGNT